MAVDLENLNCFIWAYTRPRWVTLGRRRKKTLRIMRKTLPKVFSCPKCGMASVRITSELDETSQYHIVTVACGQCGEKKEFRYEKPRAEIDVYNTFVDEFAKAAVS